MPLLGAAVLASAGAAWLVLEGRERPAGPLVLAAGGLLVAAGRVARRRGGPRVRFLDSIGDRLADPLVLVAIGWTRMPAEPRVAFAALAALVFGYLAAYLKARAAALGFALEESTVDRGVRAAAIGVGLVAEHVEAGLWIALGWSLAATVKRALEVAREPA